MLVLAHFPIRVLAACRLFRATPAGFKLALFRGQAKKMTWFTENSTFKQSFIWRTIVEVDKYANLHNIELQPWCDWNGPLPDLCLKPLKVCQEKLCFNHFFVWWHQPEQIWLIWPWIFSRVESYIGNHRKVQHNYYNKLLRLKNKHVQFLLQNYFYLHFTLNRLIQQILEMKVSILQYSQGTSCPRNEALFLLVSPFSDSLAFVVVLLWDKKDVSTFLATGWKDWDVPLLLLSFLRVSDAYHKICPKYRKME